MRTAQQPAPVVVAVDGSERSAGVVRYAVREARTQKRTVRLAHIASTPLQSSGERILERAVAETRSRASDIGFESLLGRGSRLTVISWTARSHGVRPASRPAPRACRRDPRARC
jgi:nucleotide-binding universal stress UspA family protein